MNSSKLATRYAKALFEFAKEKDQIQKVKEDLVLVKSVLKENYELKLVIESPIIFPDKKNDIFAGVFADKLSDTTFGFLSLTIKKKREPALITICDEYVRLYNKYNNIQVAFVTTVQPLSPALADAVKKLLEEETQSTIELQQILDDKIIGGLKIQIEDTLFDASILSSINKLRDEFLEYEEVYQGCYYGTLKEQVEKRLKEGYNVVFDVDVAGGCNIKEYFGERALSIFIMPPSIDELRRRLEKRGTDTAEVIDKRIAKAAQEIELAPRFDSTVINDDLEVAKKEIYTTVSGFLNS